MMATSLWSPTTPIHLTGSAVLKKSIVMVRWGKNSNKEEFGNIYGFGTKGNLETYSGLTGEKSLMTYDAYHDIEKYTPYKYGPVTNFEHVNHNLTKITTPGGAQTNYTYDEYGNIKSCKIGDAKNINTSIMSYTADGNYLSSIKDPSGNTTEYSFNTQKGTLDNFTDGKDETTYYEYYSNTDLLKSVSRTVNGQTMQNKYFYDRDRLDAIEHNNFNYSFDYDSLGNMTKVLAGTQTLVENSYEYINVGGAMRSTGRLLNTDYANNQTISYEYDALDRITARKFNNDLRNRYQYDANGNIGLVEDFVNGTRTRLIYDMGNRLVRLSDSLGNRTDFGYDRLSNLSQVEERINGATYETEYSYDDDNRNTAVFFNNGQAVKSYNYTEPESTISLNRLISSTISENGVTKFTINYAYEDGIEDSSTYRLKTVDNNGKEIGYTYDANGNIDTITNNDDEIKYHYDEAGQLIRDDDPITDKTTVYSYDNGGNIKSKAIYFCATGSEPVNLIDTYVYGYADTDWKDKLTSYDGKAITYDAIGNPLTYDGYTYTWEDGRRLASITGNGNNISYKYNDSGIRTEKTVNGITTKYHLVGDKVTYESDGSNEIYYTYDSNGNLISMNLNGTEYYYVRNGQNDIIGLVDSTGTQVVIYTYDAWGSLVSTTGTLADTVGKMNPYRYRGYRYDEETEYYYCQSRYYVPEWGRWLNADAVVGQTGLLLSHNMFAYCYNNPVNMADPDGDIALWIVGGAIGAVAGAIIAGASSGWDWRYMAAGAVGGALVGMGAGALAQTAYAGIVGAGAASGGTIVIGETMKRVISYANNINAQVYNGFKFYDKIKNVFGTKIANGIGGIHNAVWIMDKMIKQYKIVDIGIDANRATSSPYYYMESILTFFYKNKQLVEEFFK